MEHLAEGIASHLPRVPYIVEYQYDYKAFILFQIESAGVEGLVANGNDLIRYRVVLGLDL